MIVDVKCPNWNFIICRVHVLASLWKLLNYWLMKIDKSHLVFQASGLFFVKTGFLSISLHKTLFSKRALRWAASWSVKIIKVRPEERIFNPSFLWKCFGIIVHSIILTEFFFKKTFFCFLFDYLWYESLFSHNKNIGGPRIKLGTITALPTYWSLTITTTASSLKIWFFTNFI